MVTNEPMAGIEERFGSRVEYLGHVVLKLATTGQPCDVTFYGRKPALNVTFHERIPTALMYGAGADTLKQMFENIKLSNGETVSQGEIWVINPMPKSGFTDLELEAIDLSVAEEETGPNGETLRTMIRDTYHCESREEEDHFLRRFLAS